jgi:hypothetical protein
VAAGYLISSLTRMTLMPPTHAHAASEGVRLILTITADCGGKVSVA